jgi:aryl-alcohol dehydrogenase-like predicted oxidoreductase
MRTRTVGDVEVGAIGLGMMPLSNPGRPDAERAVATIHAALDAGVTLFDTADAYALGPEDVGHGEELLVRALAARGLRGEDVLVATKGGHTRTPGGGWDLDGSPAHLRRAAEASARRLGVEAVPLFQYHRPDPDVPWAESMGALRDLLDAGTIRMAGISNADPQQIEEARDIVGPGLVAVQNELSPAFRSSEPEVATCARQGLAFLPWSPLRGAGEGAFAEVAAEREVSPQQVCLAWLLAMDEVVVPIPGSSRPATIIDSAAAAELELTADELARLA